MKVLLTVLLLFLFFVSNRPLQALGYQESPEETSLQRAITAQEYCSFINPDTLYQSPCGDRETRWMLR
ncbi:MAG: hypothetical protein K9M81_01265 [Chthoniobacterales bacterium]|nr:hypothetical protein [Chthoniobacterales bacterium]